MPQDRFHFVFARQSWRWTRHIGDRVVERSADAFVTLGDCLADARRWGLHPDSARSSRSFPADAVAAGR